MGDASLYKSFPRPGFSTGGTFFRTFDAAHSETHPPGSPAPAEPNIPPSEGNPSATPTPAAASPVTPAPDSTSSPDCPEGDFPCGAISQPVMCGGCMYDNICLADSAGWQLSECADAGGTSGGNNVSIKYLAILAASWLFLLL